MRHHRDGFTYRRARAPNVAVERATIHVHRFRRKKLPVRLPRRSRSRSDAEAEAETHWDQKARLQRGLEDHRCKSEERRQRCQQDRAEAPDATILDRIERCQAGAPLIVDRGGEYERVVDDDACQRNQPEHADKRRRKAEYASEKRSAEIVRSPPAVKWACTSARCPPRAQRPEREVRLRWPA